MTPNPPNPNILIGLEEILTYLRLARHTFYKLVSLGLPAVVINGRWYSHKENLDQFFREVTRVRMKEIPEDAE